MIIRHYADVMPSGLVRASYTCEEYPDAGPAPAPYHEGALQTLAEPIIWKYPTPTSVLHWIDGAPQWVETATLAEQRAHKINALNASCAAQIVAGFMCGVLGSSYLYPAKAQDQANLVASVTDSLLAGGDPDWRTPFWCMDEAGAWEFRAHTIAQIQQVGREAKAAILAAMGKNEALRQQVEAASAEQLADIDW
jgi:hypothetical protein